MFGLTSSYRYWLYNKPVNMRKSFNGLSGIVTNNMCEKLRSGDVFIFTNTSRNMLKMLRQEEGGLVLYSIRLDMGRMKIPLSEGVSIRRTAYCSREGSWLHLQKVQEICLQENRF